MILQHCGMPEDTSPNGMALWADGMRRLAQQPNVYCKFSGLVHSYTEMTRSSSLILQAGAWSGLAPAGVYLEAITLLRKFGLATVPSLRPMKTPSPTWMRLIKGPSWQITPRAFIGYSIRNYSLRRVRAPITLSDVPVRTPLAL